MGTNKGSILLTGIDCIISINTGTYLLTAKFQDYIENCVVEYASLCLALLKMPMLSIKKKDDRVTVHDTGFLLGIHDYVKTSVMFAFSRSYFVIFIIKHYM